MLDSKELKLLVARHIEKRFRSTQLKGVYKLVDTSKQTLTELINISAQTMVQNNVIE